MRVDTNFFGTVPMPDAGDPTVAPTARRYGNDEVIACYENMLHWSQTADALGFDTWTSRGGPGVLVEGHASSDWDAGLAARGHDVARAMPFDSAFGHAHTIVVQADGTLAAAADPRARIGSAAGG